MIEVDFDYLEVYKQRLLCMCNTTYQWSPWSASSFVSNHIDVNPGSALGESFMDVANVTTQVEEALASWRQQCETAFGENGWERMGAIITSYQSAEAKNVRTFEGPEWKGGITDEQLLNAGMGIAEYVVSPLNVEVKPKTEFASFNEALGMVGNVISPSAWINGGLIWVYEQVTGHAGVDVFDKITSAISGDWESVSKASVALSALGAYYYNLGDRLVHCVWSVVPQGWLGDAAFNARDAYTKTGNAILGLQSILDDLSTQYESIANGMYSYGMSVSGLLQSLVDALIVAAAAAAAGVSFSWTGIGAILGGGATAAAIVAAAVIVSDIINTLADATQFANAYVSVIARRVAMSSGVPDHEIPQP